MNNYEDDPFVYARTAAIAVGVHENTIRNWAKRGWIRAYPLIPGHRFHRYSLDDTRACAAAQTAWRRHR